MCKSGSRSCHCLGSPFLGDINSNTGDITFTWNTLEQRSLSHLTYGIGRDYWKIASTTGIRGHPSVCHATVYWSLPCQDMIVQQAQQPMQQTMHCAQKLQGSAWPSSSRP